MGQTAYPADVDIVVVGGGPAGLAAAVSSGRMGVATLLVERSGRLGGTSTTGLLSLWGHIDDGARTIFGGLIEEILHRVQEYGGAAMPGVGTFSEISHELMARDNKRGFIPINPEILARVADEMVTTSRVRVLFHSMVVGTNVTHGTVKSVVVANKTGLVEIPAKVVVDCTGDADVVFFSGGPFQEDGHGTFQPMTLMLHLGGVDIDEYLEWRRKTSQKFKPQYPEIIEAAIKAGDLSFNPGMIHSAEPVPGMPGVVAVNLSRIPGNGADPWELSRAEIEGRRQAVEIENFFRKYIPGFSHSFLQCTAATVGVRETRRIVGHYTLTQEDIINQRNFEDSIARNAYHIDIHSADSGGHISMFFEKGHSYSIPYRCLVPLNLRNVIVAGRCISATREAQSSVRITPCCVATGQAAGIAAAMAVSSDQPVISVSYSDLRNNIRNQGGIVDNGS